MRSLFIFCTLFYLPPGCQNSSNPNKRQPSDTLIDKRPASSLVKEAFDADEILAWKSVERLKLDTLYQSCLAYLYVIYAQELITEGNTRKEVSVGECNIRLVGCRLEANNIARMIFGVFINDSIPADAVLKTSMGEMISTFDVDMNKKKIQKAKMGEMGSIQIKDVEGLYQRTIKSDSFASFLAKNRELLHPKFLKIVDSVMKNQ